MNIVIVRTGGGIKYGRRIGYKLFEFGHHFIIPRYDEFMSSLRSKPTWTRNNTIIHTRAAYPSRTGWMGDLFQLERDGWIVTNKPETIYLTSNKFKCAEALIRAGLPHPQTRLYRKRDWVDMGDIFPWGPEVILKPITSNGQGGYVKKINNRSSEEEILQIINSIPGNEIIIQDVVPYRGLYRVIVLRGNPLTTVWRDHPTAERWKVSVCLNPDMEVEQDAPQELLTLAVQAQTVVGGDINFIDIYQTRYRGYVLSEINTACNLTHHERLSSINLAFKIATELINIGRDSDVS